MKKPLQGQHYKMAAIIAKGWAYEEEGKRGRLKSVCQFNTEKLFEYTTNEKKQSGKNLFDAMKDKKIRDLKIEKCIAPPPKEGGGANVLADSIFMSHLIRQETETILNVKDIEENFLELLEISDNFHKDKETIIRDENNQKIIKDYIALQHCRNPLYYRFLLDGYLSEQIKNMCDKKAQNKYEKTYPVFFKELLFLDARRLNNFIDFANNEIIKVYHSFRESLENLTLAIYSDPSNKRINNYLGDMSCFNFNFDRFGMNTIDTQEITDYQNNKEMLDNCVYTVATSTSCIIAVSNKYFKNEEDLNEKLKTVIFPIIEKGFHNNIVFLYSKYVICSPLRKDIMLEDMKNFFDLNYKNNENFLQKFIEYREEEIGYLDGLEFLLKELKKKEKNYQ